ncbi:MAG TPA: riboflavin synthase [Chromatiaceae bacterium]|jgi:riboflavin synthase|nr:MAG: hypothetical protein N838_34570 [Thiohalocapsa sp. PB-PSB1]QQO52242.1 MAG: riboflavin synthase [Thiohalocapsa sp. PB-PSB1]HBG95422.1 riboflavin synthase [Chromatiaceae bacterium]HCS89429.1 riboflavin synthase [Chromatiaceae bacterium]
MFTGIIQAIGEIEQLQPRDGDVRVAVRAGKLRLSEASIGDSIAVNGICLTAVAIEGNRFMADLSRETLSLTTLGDLNSGARVNLETALTLSTPLGGHLVSGHIDGVGTVLDIHQDGRSWRLQIHAPGELARYIAHKGSICVDGASLTVNEIKGSVFDLNIVPHTLEETIIGGYRTGTRVNLEVDLIARYLERLVLGEQAGNHEVSAITEEFLRRHGYLR